MNKIYDTFTDKGVTDIDAVNNAMNDLNTAMSDAHDGKVDRDPYFPANLPTRGVENDSPLMTFPDRDLQTGSPKAASHDRQIAQQHIALQQARELVRLASEAESVSDDRSSDRHLKLAS